MKKYLVIYTDLGDSCDSRTRKLGMFKTYKEARAEMNKDIEQYIKDNKENGIHSEITADFFDLVLVGDDERGCQWQIMDL